MEQPHPKETEPEIQPRIYVASLSDYNAGRLHGNWIDATQEPEDIHHQVQRMLTASNEPVAEEWAIHGYEGFGYARLAEYSDFETVSRIAQGIETHGDAFSAWIAHSEDATQENTDKFEEAYLGRWDDLRNYAEHLADDMGLTGDIIPEHHRPYVKIDIDQLVTDLEIELVVAKASGGGIHVFSPYV
ncbi:MAG: antirestriction protein ArdA [bacterium]|nr:antirestriction protein ArdA [bacterium]